MISLKKGRMILTNLYILKKMKMHIIPLLLIIFTTSCGTVKPDYNAEEEQPYENSKDERKFYDQTFVTELVKDNGLTQIRVHNELEKDDNGHYTGLYTYIDIIKDDKIA